MQQVTTMGTKTRVSNADRFGRWAGGMWRGGVRRERRLADSLVARGLPAGAATALLWLMKLAVLGVLLYAAFWLALLLVFAVVTAWAVQHSTADQEEEPLLLNRQAEERDHREGLFYHPASYNDDPDPRFEGD